MSGRLGNKAFSNIKLHKNEDNLIMIPTENGFAPLIHKIDGNYFFNTEFVDNNVFNGTSPSIVISTYEDRVFRANETIIVTCTIILEAGQNLTGIDKPVTLSIGTLVPADSEMTSSNSNFIGPGSFVFLKEITFTTENAANQQIQITLKYNDNDGTHTITGYGQSITVDTIAPVFNLTNGTNDVIQHEFNTYLVLNQPEFNDLSSDSTMQISDFYPPLDTNTLGSYEKTYTATDVAGNTTTKTLTVVVQDTIKPIITITGDPVVYVEEYQSYTDDGATATEGLTESIVKVTNVDTSTADTYTVTYNVSDGTNEADEVTRTVIVYAIKAPENFRFEDTSPFNRGDIIQFNWDHVYEESIRTNVLVNYIWTIKNVSDETILAIPLTTNSYTFDTNILPAEIADYNITIKALYINEKLSNENTSASFTINVPSTITDGAIAIVIDASRKMNNVSNERTVNVYANLNKEYGNVSGMEGSETWSTGTILNSIDFNLTCAASNIVNVTKTYNGIDAIAFGAVTDETDVSFVKCSGLNVGTGSLDHVKICTVTVKDTASLSVNNVIFANGNELWDTKEDPNISITDFEISGQVDLN